jgi:hypothetical protein
VTHRIGFVLCCLSLSTYGQKGENSDAHGRHMTSSYVTLVRTVQTVLLIRVRTSNLEYRANMSLSERIRSASNEDLRNEEVSSQSLMKLLLL